MLRSCIIHGSQLALVFLPFLFETMSKAFTSLLAIPYSSCHFALQLCNFSICTTLCSFCSHKIFQGASTCALQITVAFLHVLHLPVSCFIFTLPLLKLATELGFHASTV